MANVQFIEGWGLAGTIIDDLGPATPPTLGALGWEMTSGSSRDAKLTVDERGLVSQGTFNTNRGFTLSRDIPQFGDRLVLGWSIQSTRAQNGIQAGFFAGENPNPKSMVYVRPHNSSPTALYIYSNLPGNHTRTIDVLIPNEENWVELVIDPNEKKIEIWVNSALEDEFTTTANINFARLFLGSGNQYGWNGLSIIKCLYVADERLGRCQVLTRHPTSDNSVEFQREQGDSNASQVADLNGSDGDATYVSSAQTGAQDFYDSDNSLDLVNERIHGVGLTIVGRKEDFGVRSLTPLLSRDGTVQQGPPLILQQTYMGVQAVFTSDPATGVQWTKANVEAHQFGMRLTE